MSEDIIMNDDIEITNNVRLVSNEMKQFAKTFKISDASGTLATLPMEIKNKKIKKTDYPDIQLHTNNSYSENKLHKHSSFYQENISQAKRYFKIDNETQIINAILSERIKHDISKHFLELNTKTISKPREDPEKQFKILKTITKKKEILTDQFFKEKLKDYKFHGEFVHRADVNEIFHNFKFKQPKLNKNPFGNITKVNKLLENYPKYKPNTGAPKQDSHPNIFAETNSKIYFKIKRDNLLNYDHKTKPNTKADDEVKRILSSKLKIKIR